MTGSPPVLTTYARNKFQNWNATRIPSDVPDVWQNATTTAAVASSIPRLLSLTLKSMMGATLVLYVLNQKHMLPRELSGVVSKALFWPSLPITVGRRLGRWATPIDQTVVMGGAPFGFLNVPEVLYHKYGVRGVINLCEEYRGPIEQYEALGMDYLQLPTTDHFEPSVKDLERAVQFIKQHETKGRVYVHCRAGHGRSAAAVFAWMLYRFPNADPQSLNRYLSSLRNVRRTLWCQPNLQAFHQRLLDQQANQKDPPDYLAYRNEV